MKILHPRRNNQKDAMFFTNSTPLSELIGWSIKTHMHENYKKNLHIRNNITPKKGDMQ